MNEHLSHISFNQILFYGILITPEKKNINHVINHKININQFKNCLKKCKLQNAIKISTHTQKKKTVK